MSIKYDSKREPLSEIIKKATIDATYVIPDLQRPYVWTPRQVIMLIDSLFRGWPFGSLLLWEVKPNCFQENEGIPHRPFWQVVDRTGKDQGSQNSAKGQPATYQMVLDGQQRIQSLLLALGGDQWGFQLKDSEWAQDLQDRRVKPSKHWSKASLCIDLHQFKLELEAKKNIVRKIEACKILDWVILDARAGQSSESRPASYVHPLKTVNNNPGRFIRLSRFWDIVQKDLSEREYKKILAPILVEHGVNDSDQQLLLEPLAEFMKVVENVRTNSFVHALQVESFEVTPQWSKDDYSDAIVNIFTRLNTAGRALTREEITLAWLKVGWLQDQTDNKTAGQCLDELRSSLSENGFQLKTDEIVRLISFIWAVEYRKGMLLDDKDLLKGDIVRSMAASVASMWKQLAPMLECGAALISKKDLVENQESFNAIIIFLTWYRLVFDRFAAVKGSIREVGRDTLEKQLTQRATQFLDRWVFGSQWANVWGDGAAFNFQNFAIDLHSLFGKLKTIDAANLVACVDDSISQLMARVSVKAIERINNVVVDNRHRVHAYYPFLWVWHRLEATRWRNSSIPLRPGKERLRKIEVDHTVADAWWKELVAKEIQVKLTSFIGTEEEKALVAPDGFDSVSDAIAFINILGNCSLLEKSFNISKGKKPLRFWMQEIHEIKEGKIKMEEWESALSLSSTMMAPEGFNLAAIKAAVESRDVVIRKDLVEFITGQKNRVD